jgi:hypothetical protein
MSELTTCNHCKLQRIRRDARAEGKRVVLETSRWGMGGVEVYVHPKAVNWRLCTVNMKRRYWVSWMMEVTEHCVC